MADQTNNEAVRVMRRLLSNPTSNVGHDEDDELFVGFRTHPTLPGARVNATVSTLRAYAVNNPTAEVHEALAALVEAAGPAPDA